MARDGGDDRLFVSLDAIFHEKLSDPGSGHVSVHKRHIAVHKDELKSMRLILVNGLFHLLISLSSVKGKVRDGLPVYNAEHEHKSKYNIAITFLVVHNKDPASASGH